MNGTGKFVGEKGKECDRKPLITGGVGGWGGGGEGRRDRYVLIT